MFIELELFIILLVSLALFIASVIVDRKFHSASLASFLFHSSFMFFWILIGLTMYLLFIGLKPSPREIISWVKWMVSEAGGWSGLFAAMFFSAAIAFGVMSLPAKFVDAVETREFRNSALFCLAIGIIFLVGIIDIFKGIALILGIIATIIGIFVKLKKI